MPVKSAGHFPSGQPSTSALIRKTMRILAALVFGYYLVVGRGGSEAGTDKLSAAAVPTGMTEAARNQLDRALGLSLTRTSPQRSESLRRVTRGGRVIFIPQGCASVSKPFDLVVHFHGAPTAMEPTFERSGIRGVLAVLNLGIGSGKYEEAFQVPGSFAELVERIAEVTRSMCPGSEGQVRNLALSGWSAGYGAVWRILDRQSDADRVDAVLLADGLHASFEPDKERQRVVNWPQMAAFMLYADRAVAGRKLFAITHSSISTTYASTTETAGFLLEQLDISKRIAQTPGPRPGMTMLYAADRGAFHVQGYSGNDKPAHCDHLFAMGDTLFPLLRERWSH